MPEESAFRRQDFDALLAQRRLPVGAREKMGEAVEDLLAHAGRGRFILGGPSSALLRCAAEVIERSLQLSAVQVLPVSIRTLANGDRRSEDAVLFREMAESNNGLDVEYTIGTRWLLHELLLAPDRHPEAAPLVRMLDESPLWQRLQRDVNRALGAWFPRDAASFRIQMCLEQNTLDAVRAWVVSAWLGGSWRRAALSRTPLIASLGSYIVYGPQSVRPPVWVVIVE